MFVRLRLPVLLVLTACAYAGGWWHGKNSAAGPAQHAAHAATAQLPPLTTHPPGYLTSKAPPAPPAAGAEALAKLLEQRAKPEDLASALAAWAEQDPDAAFHSLLADPRLHLPDTAQALFEVLGKNDPTQALQRLAQLPALPWARDANKSLATGWSQRDPKAATTAGLALPPGLPRVEFLAVAFGQWVKQDFLAARDWVMALPPEESRANILTDDTLGDAKIHNSEEMTALLELSQLNPDPYRRRFTEPFRQWAAESPDAALQWALALPQNLDNITVYLNLAMEPFASDPARVLSLLPQLKYPPTREHLMALAANDWAQKDPAAAWTWAAQLTDPSLREIFENNLTDRWVSLDPSTAIPWVLKNQANHLKDIDKVVLNLWAEATPNAALGMLGQLPDDDSRQDLAKNLLRGIASTQPTLALAQLDLLKENYERKTVINLAMVTWSQRDITAASTYTDALPPGEDRQAAIRSILPATFKESPESALTWATTLTDPRMKEQSIDTYLRGWQEKDPAAAQNWLEHAPLDDALRQKLTPSQP